MPCAMRHVAHMRRMSTTCRHLVLNDGQTPGWHTIEASKATPAVAEASKATNSCTPPRSLQLQQQDHSYTHH